MARTNGIHGKVHPEAVGQEVQDRLLNTDVCFDTDDEEMTGRRLRQGNLIGPAGYIAMGDGFIGGFVQRALQYNDDGAGMVMMGGHEAESQKFRASEAAIRGFWKHYRALMGE